MSIMDNGLPGILKDQFVPCHFLDRVTEDRAGLLGPAVRYVQGAALDAMLRKDNSPEVRVAERNGLKAQYTVVVKTGVTLRHEDVIRRDSDQATFRITGKTIDGQAPAASTVPIAKTTAEEWEVPE